LFSLASIARFIPNNPRIETTSLDVCFDFHTCPLLFGVDVERRRVLGIEAGRHSVIYTGEDERGNCLRGGNIFFASGCLGSILSLPTGFILRSALLF
jgi:hypothetical protein